LNEIFFCVSGISPVVLSKPPTPHTTVSEVSKAVINPKVSEVSKAVKPRRTKSSGADFRSSSQESSSNKSKQPSPVKVPESSLPKTPQQEQKSEKKTLIKQTEPLASIQEQDKSSDTSVSEAQPLSAPHPKSVHRRSHGKTDHLPPLKPGYFHTAPARPHRHLKSHKSTTSSNKTTNNDTPVSTGTSEQPAEEQTPPAPADLLDTKEDTLEVRTRMFYIFYY
jgi:hypothetical protein